MRFDDRTATVLALPDEDSRARAAKWRQLVDILAQSREGQAGAAADEAFAYLRRHRPELTMDTRRQIAASLAGRAISPDLLAFFAEDSPSIASPLISGARLWADEWLELLPRLSPTARGLLRHRRDLDEQVVQALSSFGSSDFVLSGTVDTPVSDEAEAPLIVNETVDETLLEVGEPAPADPQPVAADAVQMPAEPAESRISELVARIEAFRTQRPAVAPMAEEPPVEAVVSFQWETGTDGIFLWVEGAPRGALIGQSIASATVGGQYGVDGQAAGAFEKKTPFRDARFRVAGEGVAAGDWRLSGVPFFDPSLGSFLGYRGTARRPRPDEVAHRATDQPQGLFGTDLPTDALRQLIHELRTPLNAIVGFAEMIDGQYMGPANVHYRARAGGIVDQARRLLSAVDDLDTAARIETKRLTLSTGPAELGPLLAATASSYADAAGQRDVRLEVSVEDNLPPAEVEADAAERMFARLLAATVGLADAGEEIGATMRFEYLGAREMLCLAVDRPRAIEGIVESALLDPGYSPEGDWPGAPALGLGFALRLVRNLADAAGGALIVEEGSFALYLPPVATVGRSSGNPA